MTNLIPAHSESDSPRRHCFRNIKTSKAATIALIGFALLVLCVRPASAQAAFVSYQVAYNGGFVGRTNFVSDNQTSIAPGVDGVCNTPDDIVNAYGPDGICGTPDDVGDKDARASFLAVPVTLTDPNGIITFTANIIGEGFLIPTPGRRLRVTTGPLCGMPGEPACPLPSAPPPVPTTASVPLGYFTPLNTQFPSIELIACYDFSLLPVGPPYNFGSALSGYFSNLGGPSNDIDFAQVGWNSDCGCGLSRGQLFEHGDSAFMATPPVLFNNSGVILNHGCVSGECPRIGGYLFIKLRNNGDAVQLPGSADAAASQGSPALCGGGVPTVSEVGLILLLVTILASGTWMMIRRHRNPL